MRRLSGQLRQCRCCPRACGADRLAGERGFCRVGAQPLVAHAGLHHGEEPPISGTRGSGAIFFAGCNLRCVFCQNFQISQEFAADVTAGVASEELSRMMLDLQASGAHNINFVSPSHMVWPMADAILLARDQGLTIPIVYNSNGYDSVAALSQIKGLIDIYLPDIKYMDNELARRYSKADDYADVIEAVLREMVGQAGNLDLDEDGLARRGVIVRHLVLPGNLENSRRCLDLLAEIDPQITISLMSQYAPLYRAVNDPPLDRALTLAEYDEITAYALALGLENVFVQDLSSQDHYLPDFDRQRPFVE